MLALTRLIGFGAGGGYTDPVSVWSKTLNYETNGWANYSLRNQAISLSGGGNQARVRFQAGPSGPFVIANAAIGIKAAAGNAWDTVAVPVELLFSGASGCSITAGQMLTSDWADLTFLSTDTLIVVIDYAASGGYLEAVQSPASHAFYKAATDSYNVAAPAGFTTDSIRDCNGSNLIEARYVL